MNHFLSRSLASLISAVSWRSFHHGLLAASLFLTLPVAHAAVTITFAESGGDVIATTSGSLNTTGMTAAGYQQSSGVQPAGTYFVVGSASSNNTWSVSGFSGPINFGNGQYSVPSTDSGPAVGIRKATPGPWIILPSNYVSGTALNSSSTYSGTTLAAMGMVAGTYTWSWSGGDSITLVVQASAALSPSSQTAVTGAVGNSLSTSTLSVAGFSGTVTYSVSPSLPSGLTLNTSTGVISGVPTASQAAATYTVTGTGSSSGSATSSVSIEIAGAAQNAFQVSLNPASLRVNQTGLLSTSGGSGTGLVTYSVTNGSCTVSGTTLSAPASAGICVVTATKAADQSYTQTTATVSVTVSARASLEQAMDASVRGTLAAQTSTVSRFSSVQMSNVSGHLAQLSNSFSTSGNRVALGLGGLMPGQSSQVIPLLLAAVSSTDTDGDSVNSKTDAPGNIAQILTMQRTEETEDKVGRTSLWAAGDISRGRLGVNQGVNRFHTDGLTLGVDYQWDSRSIVGLAMGYGSDRTLIDTYGSRIKASQMSLTAYGVHALFAQWVLDGQAGYASTSIDNERYSQFNGVILKSQRNVATWFGSVGASAPFDVRGMTVRPFVRISSVQSRLGSYAEGGDMNALAFDKATDRLATLATGLSVSRTYLQGDGARWTPSVKFELRRNSNSSLDQSVSFSDAPSEVGVMRVAGSTKDVQVLGFGVSYTKPSGLRFNFGLEGARGSGGYQMGGVRVGASMPI